MRVNADLLASSKFHTSLLVIGEKKRMFSLFLFPIRLQFKAAHEGSRAKVDAQDELFIALSHRRHIDRSVWSIGKLLLLKDGGRFSLEYKRPSGHPLVDNWDCLKDMVSV